MVPVRLVRVVILGRAAGQCVDCYRRRAVGTRFVVVGCIRVLMVVGVVTDVLSFGIGGDGGGWMWGAVL